MARSKSSKLARLDVCRIDCRRKVTALAVYTAAIRDSQSVSCAVSLLGNFLLGSFWQDVFEQATTQVSTSPFHLIRRRYLTMSARSNSGSGNRRPSRGGAPSPPGESPPSQEPRTPQATRQGALPSGSPLFRTTTAVVDGQPTYGSSSPPSQPDSTPRAGRQPPSLGPIGQLTPTGPRPGQQLNLPHRPSPSQRRTVDPPVGSLFGQAGPSTLPGLGPRPGPSAIPTRVDVPANPFTLSPEPPGTPTPRRTLSLNPVQGVQPRTSRAEAERTVQEQIGIDRDMEEEDRLMRQVSGVAELAPVE